jgi:FtsZ-binding cell division protein ZapB
MKKIEDIKEDKNNCFKEIQENTFQQVEALKEETYKFQKKYGGKSNRCRK